MVEWCTGVGAPGPEHLHGDELPVPAPQGPRLLLDLLDGALGEGGGGEEERRRRGREKEEERRR